MGHALRDEIMSQPDRSAEPEYRPHTLEHFVEGVAACDTLDFAREQRHAPTASESLLWSRLRQKRIGYKFRRQHPFGDFVLDFFCLAARLAIELDGAPHARQRGYDEWRDGVLASSGIMTWRVAAARVESDLPGVIGEIKSICGARVAQRRESQ